MDKLEPGTMCLTRYFSGKDPTIHAVEPVNRDALKNYIANVRQMYYQGIQVPITVVHFNPETGDHREELIPGCATCSI